MMRFLLSTVLVMFAAGRAAAQTTTTPTTGGATFADGASINFNKLFVNIKGKFVQTEATSNDRLRYFNLAHCNCARVGAGEIGRFQYLMQLSALSGFHVPVDFWVGTGCGDVSSLQGSSATCRQVGSVPDIDVSLYPGGDTVEFSLYDALNGINSVVDPTTGVLPDCVQADAPSSQIYAFVSTTEQKPTYDYQTSVNVGTLPSENTTGSGIDTLPPPQPTNLNATGGDGTIHITWTAPAANNTDINTYQALCAKLDDTPGLPKPVYDARYVSSMELCGAPGDPALMPVTLAPAQPDDQALTAPTAGLATLDPLYLCGELDTATGNQMTIKGLENGTQYQIILMSIDLHGNYTPSFFTSTVTPEPTTDFWEDLHDRGSDANGGLCLLAETYGDDNPLTGALRGFRDDNLGGSAAGRWLTRAYYATLGKLGGLVHGSLALRIVSGILLLPLVLVALAWHWLSLPGLIGVMFALWLVRYRRPALRRMWRWLGDRRWLAKRPVQLAAGIAIVVAGLGRAHAGGGYQPYWEDNEVDHWNEQKPVEGPAAISWHVGFRIGPYTPDIDKQLGGSSPGPYRQMFGGARYTPMLDVDRILWTKFGQLGVGISLGYMQKTAHTFYVDPTSGMTIYNHARTGDTNTFHLLPTELSATYRFTVLDDQYGIPVVPYVRAGLAYYVWWVGGSGGPGVDNFLGVAQVCQGGGTEPSCSQNKALGASFGVQASIGLALRAEQLDSSAANSMRASGLQHAGVYAELSLAQVNGFGSDSRLSVGDRTWFAGVDFEF